MSRTTKRPLGLMAAGVTGLLMAAAGPGTASASPVSASTVSAFSAAASRASASTVSASTVSASRAARWRITASVRTADSSIFTAVVATGKTTGWAFDGFGLTSPSAAYRLNGSGWKKAPFPGRKNEEVIRAAATSPTNVWAFTQNFSGPSRVLHYNGHAWSVVRTFSAEIADATVLSSSNVWVYGEPASPGLPPALGVWHYNGSVWKRVSQTFQGGSALSATNVWGFNGVDIEHWTGRKWLATSVRSLLPATIPGGLNDPAVRGILAVSAKDVYAVGNGDDEDDGGPLVVLHDNGKKWSKVATGLFGFGPGDEFSTDGSGGLWLPMTGPAGGSAHLVHYAAGKLTVATLPVSAARINVVAVSRIPGTAQQLAGGFTHASSNLGANVVAVLLKYS